MNAGKQVPDSGVAVAPLQFFEQQSPASVHESPSVLHPFPPGRAAHAVAVPTPVGSHSPVQHDDPSAHAVPVFRHGSLPQCPASQESEQHSPGDVQEASPGLQKVAVAQVPVAPLHSVEQHSAPVVQLAPLGPHVVAGDAHVWEVASHRPEQQSLAAVHAAVRPAHSFAGTVHTPFAHAFVQQLALVRQLPTPAALQVAVATHALAAQPRLSPAQQSVGSEHDSVMCEHAGTWHVLGLPAVGQTRPAQQSPSAAQYAVATPQAAAAVHRPLVQLSLEAQHGFVGLHVSFVPPQSAGATQVPPVHESAPLQHGCVPSHVVAPVAMQATGAVQTLPVQLSAPLQQRSVAQDAPVPAHEAGAVQIFDPVGHVSAPLQQAAVAHEEPVPAQTAGAVQTFAVHVSPALQHEVPPAQEDPVPAHVGAVQTLPVHESALSQQATLAHEAPVVAQVGAAVQMPAVHESVPVQQASDAHEVPVAAQVGPGGGPSFGLLQPASVSATSAATASDVNAGRALRIMRCSSTDLPGTGTQRTTRRAQSRCSGVGISPTRSAAAAPVRRRRVRGGLIAR